MRFPRASRLTRERDLEAVRLQGKRVRTAQLEVRYLASPLAHARIGIVVPRYGHTAVERNVVKRRLRDLARRELLPVLAAAIKSPHAMLDVVIRATPGAYAASHATLRAALQKVAPQLPHAVPQLPPAATGNAQ